MNSGLVNLLALNIVFFCFFVKLPFVRRSLSSRFQHLGRHQCRLQSDRHCPKDRHLSQERGSVDGWISFHQICDFSHRLDLAEALVGCLLEHPIKLTSGMWLLWLLLTLLYWATLETDMLTQCTFGHIVCSYSLVFSIFWNCIIVNEGSWIEGWKEFHVDGPDTVKLCGP